MLLNPKPTAMVATNHSIINHRPSALLRGVRSYNQSRVDGQTNTVQNQRQWRPIDEKRQPKAPEENSKRTDAFHNTQGLVV